MRCGLLQVTVPNYAPRGRWSRPRNSCTSAKGLAARTWTGRSRRYSTCLAAFPVLALVRNVITALFSSFCLHKHRRIPHPHSTNLQAFCTYLHLFRRQKSTIISSVCTKLIWINTHHSLNFNEVHTYIIVTLPTKRFFRFQSLFIFYEIHNNSNCPLSLIKSLKINIEF